MPSFTYSKLGVNSVRLLKIHSPVLSNTASGRLELVHVLDSDLDNIRYEAVSYVWGLPKRNKKFEFVDGSSSKITVTLEQALPHLISASTTGMLWIDQLCINQKNNEEKSQQVPKMGIIYTHAERTLAWLGVVPAAYTQFSSLVPAIHQELDTWTEIHGGDPLLECPDELTSTHSAFDLFRQIVHDRRTLRTSQWGAMMSALDKLGFESHMRGWQNGKRGEWAGGYLFRWYRLKGGKKEYRLRPLHDETRLDLDHDHKAESADPRELEILAREDALMFYGYRAVLSISKILAEGSPQGLSPSFNTIIQNIWPLLEFAFGHPWSTRVWITQEAKLSSNLEFLINDEIFKPRDLIRLNDLVAFCRSALNHTGPKATQFHKARWSFLFRRNDDGTDHDYRDPLSAYLIRRMNHAPVSIEEATDPRDMIYGLLPVCKTEVYLPATDYSLNVRQVYAAATRYFVARQDSLWVLQFCYGSHTSITAGHKGLGQTDLPSWVPDWSGYPVIKPLSTSYYPCIFNAGCPGCMEDNDGRLSYCSECGEGGIAYSAAGQRKHVAVEESLSEVLTIRGKIIDHVLDLVFESEDWEWEGHLRQNLPSLTTSQSQLKYRMNEVLRAIAERAARFRHVTTLEPRDILEFLFTTPHLYKPSAFRASNLDVEDLLRMWDQDDAQIAEFDQTEHFPSYFEVLVGRNFALTASEFYLGPDTMQVGDVITIIHGSEFPLVLRPLDNDSQMYQLIGQCVVRDRRIMFGDAVDWEEADAQIFRLV